MICSARRWWPVSAFVVALFCCDVAPAVEGVLYDSDYFGIRGSTADGTALVGQRFGGLDGNGDVGVNDFLLLLAAWGPCP